MKSSRKIFIVSWGHVEGYPPTLNAVNLLAKKFEKVIIYHCNFRKNTWKYPDNVVIHNIGKYISYEYFYKLSKFSKVLFYLNFYFKLLFKISSYKPGYVLAYDAVSLFYVSKIRWCLNKNTKYWYHNHDVSEQVVGGRQSNFKNVLAKTESKSFKWISFFTLPSKERLNYFDLTDFTGTVKVIPNYPSFDYYSQFQVSNKHLGKEVRFIFQGSITEGHGFEEIIPLLGDDIFLGKILTLTLIGYISDAYKENLLFLAKKHGKGLNLKISNPVPYCDLPAITTQHHIGIGIHNTPNIVYQTGGTASNKLYEYMALGLPMLYYDSKHYNKYLEKYKWAVNTDLSKESLVLAITYTIENYDKLTTLAMKDFERELNFEKHFYLPW